MFSPDFSVQPTANIQKSLIPVVHHTWNQQTPEYMPWGLISQPRVTRFSGESDQPPFTSQEQILWSNNQHEPWKSVSGPLTTKRKIEDPCEERTRKQLITEDKIAAHMSQLNIGGNIEANQTRPDESMEENGSSYFDGIKIDESSTVVLSEELRRFQSESSIPPSLLENFMKPSMAVVLWTPRNTVDHLLRDISAPAGQPDRLDERTERSAQENDIELLEDDSNNNEPISNFNLNEPNLPDLEMDDDL